MSDDGMYEIPDFRLRELLDRIDPAHAIAAIGYLSAELAGRADAWNGNAPDWFPEPPEWLDLWNRALDATAGKRCAEQEAGRLRIELARAEAVLVAADRVREAYEAMIEGRDVGRLPEWQQDAALSEERARPR